MRKYRRDHADLLRSCWAIAFVAIAIAAAALGFAGVAGMPGNAAWTLLLAAVVFAACFFGFEDDSAARSD